MKASTLRITKRQRALIKQAMKIKPKPYPRDCITTMTKKMLFKDKLRWTLCDFKTEIQYREQQNTVNISLDQSDIYARYVQKMTSLFRQEYLKKRYGI